MSMLMSNSVSMTSRKVKWSLRLQKQMAKCLVVLLLDDVDFILPVFVVVVLLDDVDGLFKPDAVAFNTGLDVQGDVEVVLCAIFSILFFDVM